MSAEIHVTVKCNDCGASRREPAAGMDVLKRVRERLATQGWWNEFATRGPACLRKDYCPACVKVRRGEVDKASNRNKGE